MIPITKYSIHIFFSIAIIFIDLVKLWSKYFCHRYRRRSVRQKDINGKEPIPQARLWPIERCTCYNSKGKSKVTLANNDKSICKLESTGEFKVSELVFQDASNFNMFNKFCKYFTSFLQTMKVQNPRQTTKIPFMLSPEALWRSLS